MSAAKQGECTFKTSEVVSAISSLEEASLLDVMQDYFTTPSASVLLQQSVNADSHENGFSMTSEVASAINSLLHLEEGDQASLLDVIHDYFTMPSASSSCDPKSDSDSDPEVAGKSK